MDFHLSLSNTLINRKSCRDFDPDKRIDQVQIDLLDWASCRAPYASGGPRRKPIFVTNFATKERLMGACMGQKYVRDCSLVCVFCGTDPGTRLRQGFSKFVFDCSTACMCVDLMAVSLGFGTCWIGNFIPDRVAKILGTDLRPTIILLVGYRI